MKRIILIILVLVVAPVCFAAVDESKHDLSATGGPYSGVNNNQICVFCHTPHGAYGPPGGPYTNNIVPLWNHATTSATFTVYTSPTGTLDGSVSQPGSASKACLSCHDGTLSFGNLYNPPATTYTSVTMAATSTAFLGVDLSNDHPVSVTYVSADTGLNNPTGLTGVRLYPSNAYGSTVECASCHNVHEPGTGDTAPFLRASMTNSGLCTQCHAK